MYPEKFVKKLALDFIIGPDSKIYLIELQHGFGRVGLRKLFDAEFINYRRLTRQWQRKHEPNDIITQKIRKLCRSKAMTYKIFSKYQPSTYIVKDWKSSSIQSWLSTISSPYILAKPTFGSCGEGIHFLQTEQFNQHLCNLSMFRSMILQEYVFSRDIYLDGSSERKYKGCIRHILFLKYNGSALDIMHMPSYWRVAPVSINEEISRESMTANISRGAMAIKTEELESEKIIEAANEITRLLIAYTLEREDIQISSSQMLSTKQIDFS